MELAWQHSEQPASAAIGVGVFDIYAGAAVWQQGWDGRFVIPGGSPCISFALVPIRSRFPEPQSFRRDGDLLDLHLPTNRPGLALRCRIDSSSQDFLRLRRDLHRVENHRSSAWAIAGMQLLLALCGWIVEGVDGAYRAITNGGPQPSSPAISREAMYRWFGARLLTAAEVPGLFNLLADVCHRAGLRRLPDLYYVAARSDMNAYAIGGPDGAAIVLTGGLLNGMTPGELAGILAHEIAHICNNDTWAMDWMAELRRAIESTSLTGLALLHARNGLPSAHRTLAALLSAAPAIGQLLCLALCRIRELDADATALELTEDLDGLVGALDKLERHHTGYPVMSSAAIDDGSRLLRSHPATAERIGSLLSLAH
jgi:heat shock protein HtpX